MLRRIKTTAGTLVALGALALGGSAIAAAAQGHPRATSHHSKVAVRAAREAPAGKPDGDNVQSGDQSTPDSASASATKAEAPDSGSGAERTGTEADGPGGHQDPPGANVDNQSQGQQ